MAKKKQDQEEGAVELHNNAFQPEPVKVADPSHLKPQAERTEPLERPKAVHPSHLKPMEEVKPQEREVKVADRKHLKPQE